MPMPISPESFSLNGKSSSFPSGRPFKFITRIFPLKPVTQTLSSLVTAVPQPTPSRPMPVNPLMAGESAVPLGAILSTPPQYGPTRRHFSKLNASADVPVVGLLLLVRRRWIILHELGYGFIQILLTLLRTGLGIQGLACHSSPDQVVIRGIIHVDRELPLVDHRGISGGCRPAGSNTVAGQLGKSPFNALIGLVPNEQIGISVTVDLLKTVL